MMTYTAEISRGNRGCILFLLDESGSMDERLEIGTKAQEVSAILNRTLQDLIVRCAREEGVRDYFDVGVIGYGGNGPRNALAAQLGPALLNPISQIEAHPLRIEDRIRSISDGAGGLVEVQTKFPIWYDPVSTGGTPMQGALTVAAQSLLDWCDAHPSSFPPVVLHLTDGAATDGTPTQIEGIAEQVREISTDDGQALLMNIHVSGVASRSQAFPDSEDGLADEYARLLFRMSSVLPESMRTIAAGYGYSVNPASRAFIFQARSEDIVRFFDIGTRPSNLR